jgi:uncharacterized repeat protein (TIGR01451 family)/LPXTG-motif cell wall-anchored protein
MGVLTLIRRAPKRLSAAVLMVAAAILIPATLLAWGPDRQTYTYEQPAGKVTFNSITNNPQIGDERNFVRIREEGTTQNYGDNVNLVPGKVYEMMVYYHNNAASNLNASGKGIAKDVMLRMELPGIVKPGVNAVLAGNISASNADPGTVWDEAYGKNTTNADIALRYLSGSAKVSSNGAVDGMTLPDSLFTTGTKLGYDALDGILKGCNEYAGYVTFKFRVDQPNFTVKKEVSTDGKTWKKSVSTTPGSTVQYRLTYQNTGTTQQDNVSVRDMLPNGVSYVAGSTVIANQTTGGSYKSTIDGITTVGYNAGSYQPKGNVFFKISAKMPSASALACGTNKLTNTVRVTTSGGSKEDTADVTINKECEPGKITVCELATNKIITIKETDFDATKYTKDLSKCDVKTIQVCELSTKKIITINESQFDSAKHTKDLGQCVELPQTGPTETILGLVGLGAIVASLGYFIASRRAASNL